LPDEFSPTELTRRVVVIKSWNQAPTNLPHSESWESQSLLHGRHEVDFDNACAECIRSSRESAHDVNNDDDTTSLARPVNTLNDLSDHAWFVGPTSSRLNSVVDYYRATAVYRRASCDSICAVTVATPGTCHQADDQGDRDRSIWISWEWLRRSRPIPSPWLSRSELV